MISVRLFELLSKLFRTVRCNNLPFGDIQLISVGDFFQLAPTKGPYDDGKYCFLSETWTKIFSLSHCFILTKIFRQSDPEFLKILEEIEFASVCEETKTKLRELCRPLQVPEGECGLRLNPRVMESFIINREKLHENVSANDLYVIKAIDSGDLSSGQLDQLLPVRKDLVIKLGCPLKCVHNTDNQIKNGSRGIVTSFINNFPVVHFQRENRVMYFSPSARVLWCVNKQGKTGKRLQIPIVAAYVITIHKSQGMAIHYGELNVDRLWGQGQGYTGFSRFTTMEGLRLLNWTGGPLNIVSKDVVRYNNFLRSRPANCTSSLISSATPTELSYCNCMQNDQVGQDKSSKLQTLSNPQPEATIGNQTSQKMSNLLMMMIQTLMTSMAMMSTTM